MLLVGAPRSALGLHPLGGLVGVGHLLGVVQALPRQGIGARAGRPQVCHGAHRLRVVLAGALGENAQHLLGA